MKGILEKHGLGIALLFAAIVLWWWPLLAGFLPDFMDTVTYLYPMRVAVARQVAEGTLPLWLPNQFAGTPLAANPQVAVWYPFNWAFYVFPNVIVFGGIILLHYVFAAVGFVVWAAGFTRNRLWVFLVAGAFVFGSMMVSRIALLPHVIAVAYLPWMFASTERLARARNGLVPALWLGILGGLQLLSGAPQIVYYSWLALGGLCVVRVMQLRRYWVLVWYAGAVVLTLGLAAVQVIPTLNLIGQSDRGVFSVDRLKGQALNDSFLWKAVLGGTGPTIEDTDSINAVGPALVLLAAVGIFAGKRTRFRMLPYLIIAGFSWLMAAGFIAEFLYRLLPGYDKFQAPRRALILWSLCVPIAAIGGMRMMTVLAKSRRVRLGLRIMLAVLVAVPVVWMLPRLERVWLKDGDRTAPAELLKQIGNDRFLTIDPTFQWSYGSRHQGYGRSLSPNAGAALGLFDVQGYDPIITKSAALLRDFATGGVGSFYPSHGAFWTDLNSPVLDLMRVRYVVGRYLDFEPGRVVPGTALDKATLGNQLKLVQDDPFWPVYDRGQMAEIAWFVSRTSREFDRNAALANALAGGPNFDEAFGATLESKGGMETPVVRARFVTAKEIDVNWDVPLRNEGYLILAMPFVEGWRAYSIEEEGVVDRANGALMGMKAPAGATAVRLRYEPASFNWGMGITCGSLLLILALFALQFLKQINIGKLP